MYFAAHNGTVEVVALLLEKGAAVEAKGKVRTPTNGTAASAPRLVTPHALMPTQDGKTALMISKEKGHVKLTAALVEYITAALEAKATVRIPSKRRWRCAPRDWMSFTHAHFSVCRDSQQCAPAAQFYKSISVPAPQQSGWTALHQAAKDGCADVVEALLKRKGTVVDAKDAVRELITAVCA